MNLSEITQEMLPAINKADVLPVSQSFPPPISLSATIKVGKQTVR